MNPVFWILVVAMAVILWCLLSLVFYPIGKYITKIISDAITELCREDKEDKEKENKQ